MVAYFERFTIEMTLKQARGASQRPRCDEDVATLLATQKMRRQLEKIADEDLAAELKEYGAWNTQELRSRGGNEARIVWIAAGNIAEENRNKK